MGTQRIMAVVLVAAGAMALVYGGLSYTSETHSADLGPLPMSVSEMGRVNFPVWAGIGAVVAGGLLLVTGRRS